MKNSLKKIITTTSILSFALLGTMAIASLNGNQNDFNTEATTYVSKVKSDSSIEVDDIEVTDQNVLISTIENDGEHLYAWGNNANKIVASANQEINDLPDVLVPAEIELDGWNSSWKIQEIELTDYYAGALILDSIGQQHLFMWGNNSLESSAEGEGDYVNLIYGHDPELLTRPVEVDLSMFDGQEISNIELTRDSGMIITSETSTDHIYTWGDVSKGAVGNGDTTGIVATPTEITLPGFEDEGFFIDDVEGYMGNFRNNFTASSVFLMSLHDINDKSYVYTWGSTDYDISGVATVEPDPENPGSTIEVPVEILYEPTLLAGELDGQVPEVDFGQDTGAVIYDDGTNQYIYQWGFDAYGSAFNELDDENEGSNQYFYTPVLTYSTEGTEWTEIDHLALSSFRTNFRVSNSEDREIMGWGKNYAGILLQPTEETALKYNLVTLNTGFDLDKLTLYDATNDTNFAVVDGDLYTWGADRSDGNNGSYLKGTPTVKGEYGYSIPARVELSLEEIIIVDEEPGFGNWWILFIIITVLAILIMAWIWYEFHEDHKEKHEHHWFHIGRHHE